MDTDRNGQVSRVEFQTWFQKCGLNLSLETIDDLLGPGEVDLSYHDFVAFVSQFQSAGAGTIPAAWELPDQDDARKIRAHAERRLARRLALEAESHVDSKIKLVATEALDDAMLLSTIGEKIQNKRWKMMTAFKSFDKDRSGRVSIDEFVKGCEVLGLNLSREQTGQLFQRFRTTDGQLKYFQFVRLISSATGRESQGGAATASVTKPLNHNKQASSSVQSNPSARKSHVHSKSENFDFDPMATSRIQPGAGKHPEAEQGDDDEDDEAALAAMTPDDISVLMEFGAVLEDRRPSQVRTCSSMCVGFNDTDFVSLASLNHILSDQFRTAEEIWCHGRGRSNLCALGQ